MNKLFPLIIALLLSVPAVAQQKKNKSSKKSQTEMRAAARKEERKEARKETRAEAKADTALITIRGTVFENESLQPLEGATVRLLRPDSTLAAGHTTDRVGQFHLPNVKRGTYVLKVSYMGFQTQQFRMDLANEKKGNYKTRDILLREEAKLLAEAVVSGQMPEMTIVEDTTVYHADAFALPEGSMVEDLVKRLPGVVEEEDGSLTFNGKTVSQILVDGKQFFGNNRDLVMKNLPADIIDKVKAYDRQSDLARMTGIDDGNEKTVLDLAIKKNKKKGWFGQGEGGYGTHDRYHGKLNVNRFDGKQKFSLLGNGNNTRGDGMTHRQEGGINVSLEPNKDLEMDGSIYADFDQGTSQRSSNSQSFVRKSYSNSQSSGRHHSRNMGLDFDLEWKLDSLTEVKFKPNFNLGGNDNRQQSINATFNDDPYAAQPGIEDPIAQIDELPKKIRVNRRNNTGFSQADNYNANASLQISHKFGHKKSGRNLTLGLSGGMSNDDQYSDSYNQVDYYRILAVTGEDSIYHKTQYNDNQSRNWNAGARLSYSEPVGEGMYLQFSYSYNHRHTLHQRDVRSIFDPLNNSLGINSSNYALFFPHSNRDTAQCNNTTNTYRNHSASVQYRIVRTQYRLTAGVNVQPQTNQVDYNKGFKSYNVSRTVVNAAPTIDFRYRFSRQEQLRLRYGGTTGQPAITDLIPDTLNNANPLNIRLGNPDLKPSFTQNLQAEYQKSIPEMQRSWNADLQFHLTQNSVSSRTEYDDETGGRVTMPVNVNGNWSGHAGFGFNTALSSDKRFRMSAHTGASITNSVGYVYQSQQKATTRNRTRGTNANQTLRFTFHDQTFEANLHGSFRYNHSRSTSTTASNLDTYTFNYGASAQWQLPWHMSVGTDISMRSRRGYADQHMNTDQLLWNAQVSQRLLPQRNLILTLRAYDILNQRDEVTRRITEQARTDSRSAIVNQYVVLSVMYRFGKFGGKTKKKDKEREANSQPFEAAPAT